MRPPVSILAPRRCAFALKRLPLNVLRGKAPTAEAVRRGLFPTKAALTLITTAESRCDAVMPTQAALSFIMLEVAEKCLMPSHSHDRDTPEALAVPAPPSRGWLEPLVLSVLRVARRCGPLELVKLLLSLGKHDLGRDNRTVDTLVIFALASSGVLCATAPNTLRAAPASGVAIYLFCAWRLLEIQIYTFDVLFAAPLRHKNLGATRLSGPIRHLMMRFLNYVDMILLFAIMNYAIRSQLSNPMIDIIGCIYYSTAIITTLGFGDISAMGHHAQLLAVSETLFGLFFVVTALSYTVSVVSTLHPLASTRFSASEGDRRSPPGG